LTNQFFAKLRRNTIYGAALAAISLSPGAAFASSHQDAPLIMLDAAANTTDVYSFVTQRGAEKYLTVALGVFPFEEPGVGPNLWRFDDQVRYQIHISRGANLAKGIASTSYQFQFKTNFKNDRTILDAFTGVVKNVDDAAQNLTQTYTVEKVSRDRDGTNDGFLKAVAPFPTANLTTLTVPPNNQGNATPFYNGNAGEGPAKGGVATEAELDRYTRQSIFNLNAGYRVFAGQRDDGFYGDIQAIFDLLKLRSPGVDSQGGFNIHMIVLEIPLVELGGDQQVVGVYASTQRRQVRILSEGTTEPVESGDFVQVGRQGNPLFNEGLVAIRDKDLYSRTSPSRDANLFAKYALRPELAKLLNLLVFDPDIPGIETDRTDLVGIFIPDLIKTDLSTGPARLAGGGPRDSANPDDPGFSRQSIFGPTPDTLTSTVQPGFGNGTVPGGWPNGRRFGDDVVDIAVTAIISDLRTSPPTVRGPAGDNVSQNDIAYNKVFPYEGTPQNGRTHSHHMASQAQ